MKFLASFLLLFAFPAYAQDPDRGIPRSHAQVAAFKRLNPCPANGHKSGACPGYVVDHTWPLCAGGADRPHNMQWQTKADAAAKDKLEWLLCREMKK